MTSELAQSVNRISVLLIHLVESLFWWCAIIVFCKVLLYHSSHTPFTVILLNIYLLGALKPLVSVTYRWLWLFTSVLPPWASRCWKNLQKGHHQCIGGRVWSNCNFFSSELPLFSTQRSCVLSCLWVSFPLSSSSKHWINTVIVTLGRVCTSSSS